MRKKSNPSYQPRQQKRRSFVSTDFLLDIYPLTDNQQKLFDYYDDGKNIVAHGAAGTGKTMVILYKAIKEVLDPSTLGRLRLTLRTLLRSHLCKEQNFALGF